MRPAGEKSLRLPPPRAEAWDWQMYATCRAYDVNDFYDTAQESRKVLAAKKVCAGCPVLTHCRDHAVTTNEPHGIWGGMTPRERAKYRWVHYWSKRV